ncbi:MAG: ABC transporter permease [Xanthobacteraceae bacterium]
MNLDTLTVYIASTLHYAVPLMLAASGELVSEVAGVLNLSLEGMMLFAAFFAIWGTSVTGSAWVGLLCGIGSGIIFSALQALLSVRLRANQLVVGIGLNILALGATTFLNREIFGALSRDLVPGFGTLYIPGLSALPIIGPSLFQQYDVVYVGIALIAIIWFVLRFNAYGVECRAVGDDPRSADWAGISVSRVRVIAILVTGSMAGVAGTLISVGDIRTFTEGMTNGAGYLAIAAIIFGGWRLWPTVGACILFGAAMALQFQFSGSDSPVPTAALLMLPYVLALLSVAGLVGRQVPPAALTIPFLGAR